MEWIEIGFASKPHGIRGEFRVICHSISASRLLECKRFAIKSNHQYLEFAPEKQRVHQGKLILKAPEINTRSDAELWRDASVLIPADDCPDSDPLTLELFDIDGFVVKSEKGEYIGKVEDVIQLPTQQCLVILYEGRELLVPWVDEFVLSVDLEQKEMTINLLDGLLD
ncbi:16S rRNA processing protein RimM [bacterium]|nr:16S rRNA processing protein RimM [bacterium]